MVSDPSAQPLAVVALGGNALLRRGEPATAANQLQAARDAAGILGPVSETTRLVVTHGNGPQVGLLALKEDAYVDGDPYPLDVLDAESGGQIGYVIELELDNAIDHQDTVAVITRVLVDADDPAFGEPTKFIGPVYDEDAARALAAERGWTVKPDGAHWRRVVPSPDPKQIVQLGAIRRLVEGGFLVVGVGGGGVPVVAVDGGHEGVEAVIDKDLASALLAVGLEAEVLALATDVDAVYVDWGTPDERAVARATPRWLRGQEFAGGSMAPKVEAVCRFVEATGGRAAIGRLEDISGLLAGTAGTRVEANGPEVEFRASPRVEAPASPEDQPQLSFLERLPLAREAVEFAVERHSGQLRAGDHASFVVHPVEVAALLHRSGYPDFVVAAAVLHDVLEDTDVERAEIEADFGPAVAALVAAVSDDPSIADEGARKDQLRERIRGLGGYAAAVYAADKVSKVRELRTLLATGAHWSEVEIKVARHRRSLEMLDQTIPGSRLVEVLRFELEALKELPPAETPDSG